MFHGHGERKVWEATTCRYADVTNTSASFVGLINHHNSFGTENQDMLVIFIWSIGHNRHKIYLREKNPDMVDDIFFP